METLKNNGEDRPSTWKTLLTGGGTAEDCRSQHRIVRWSIAWSATLLAATWVIQTFEGLPDAVSWLIALLPNALAIITLLAYLEFLRSTDELQRRIQLEGLAFGFGGGWFFAIGYQVLERAGAPELTAPAVIVAMTGAWGVGQILAIRRYQ
jgi:hypothetical protein